jgi:hypothetical protein
MKCAVLLTLALALAVAARPTGRGKGRGRGRGGRGRGGANTTKAATATSAVSSAAAATSVAAVLSTSSAAAAASSAASTAAANSTSSAAGAVNTATTATANNPDIQNSLTLDPSVIASGFLNNGQSVPAAGQVASLTSGNNFINFCATVPQLPITNGQQITTGSCNPAPMGIIPSNNNMPSAKFTFPVNGGTIATKTPFTISVAVSKFTTGNFVNAQQNYFAAPQQLDSSGQILGHSHVVVEQLTSLTQTTPTDPKVFAFFKGLNAAAVNGVLTADVANGLPAGTYKVSTINTAANHQPVLVPVAQHGSLDDVVYFTVADGGAAAANSTLASAGAASSVAGAAAATSSSAAAAAATSSAAAAAATTASVNGAAAVTTSAAQAAATTSAASAAATTSAAQAAATTAAAAAGKGKRSQLSRSL